MEPIYKLMEEIELVEMDAECLILNTAHLTITTVNSVGADILRAISEEKGLRFIVDLIQMKYEVEAQTAQHDAVEFLEEIRKMGIVSCLSA